jgi:hypothetical protein
MKHVNTDGEWRIVNDDHGHSYLIPADKKSEFREWVAHTNSDGDGFYTGDDYNDCRLWMPSPYYTIVGKFKAD